MTAATRRLVWLGTFLLCLVCERALAQNPDPKLIEGAKKEGQMVFYTTMTLDQSKEVVDRFQKNIRSSSRHCFAPVAGRY